jgi:two-component system, LuxR family, response regulator FixJ
MTMRLFATDAAIVDMAVQRSVHVIDDDEAVRDSMRALLESMGIEVSDYASARDFLVRLDDGPAGCVLLDLHMPGMTGLELLDLLRARGVRIPVVAISGRSDGALKERVLRAGARALLEKPVDEATLMHELDCIFFQKANGH